MTPINGDVKEKLLQATLELFNEGIDPEKITTRDIVKRAGVNLALVNYHFQSKENLIQQAIGIIMRGIAAEMYDDKNMSDDPVEKLRSMIKKNSELALRYHFLMKKGIAFELKSGSEATVRTILPILRKIFPEQKTERELRLIALQLLVPLQTMFMHAEVYLKNMDLKMNSLEDVNDVIDVLINNLLPIQK